MTRPTNTKEDFAWIFFAKNKLPHFLKKKEFPTKTKSASDFFFSVWDSLFGGEYAFCGRFLQTVAKVIFRNQVGSQIESQVPFVWNVGPLNKNIARYRRANLNIKKSWVTSKSCKLISLHTCVKSNVKNQQHVEVKGDYSQIIQEASTKTPKMYPPSSFIPTKKNNGTGQQCPTILTPAWCCSFCTAGGKRVT